MRWSLPLAALAALTLSGFALATAVGAPSSAERAVPTAPAPSERLVAALLEPERIASVDLRTGAVTRLLLTAGTLCRSPLLVVDDRILFLAPGRHGGRVMSVDVALHERPHWLADADVAVPSPVPGHVWIASRGVGPHGHWLVQDLTVRGGAIARSPRRAPSRWIVGAVSEGLLLQGRGGTFVWDPRSGRRLRGTPGRWVLAAQGPLVASCGGDCGTLLLADGRRGRVVHAPAGACFLPTGAAISAAGDLLAVPLSPARRPRLALVETATGRLRVLAGARLDTRAPLAFAPDESRVYAADERSTRVRAFAVGGGAAQTVGPRFAAPIVQLLAARATAAAARVPHFAWLPAGWRQPTDAPTFAGAPTRGSVLATSWPYRPAAHGPAGALPAGGVMVSVQLLPRPRAAPRAPGADPQVLAPLVLPAQPAGALEGRPGVPEYRIQAACGTRRVEVRVDVAARRLGAARRAQVQRMLDGLVLPAPPSGCLRAP